MLFTRQLRALMKLAVLWSVPWTLAGLAVGIYRWVTTVHLPTDPGSLLGWLATHGLAFGTLGLISGLDVGLLLARAERGRRVEQIKPGRLVLWGVIGGMGPPLLFGLLGLLFGAPSAVFPPLAGLGIVSAAISGGLISSALRPRGRRAFPPEHEVGKLGAP
jgi:hypothetical protein